MTVNSTAERELAARPSMLAADHARERHGGGAAEAKRDVDAPARARERVGILARRERHRRPGIGDGRAREVLASLGVLALRDR